MTNAQNLGTMIIDLMKHEAQLKEAYNKADEWCEQCWDRVKVWEEAYTESCEDKAIGATLDEVYNEYDEANEAMREAEEKAEAIAEALEALRNASEIIEWLGL